MQSKKSISQLIDYVGDRKIICVLDLPLRELAQCADRDKEERQQLT